MALAITSRDRGATTRLIGFAVVLALLTLPGTAARGEDNKTAARDHWERGTKFYDLGKYDDAIREFEAAYEAKTDAAFLYNLAQSHRLAGHTNDALRFYRTYLRYVPKAPNRADIEMRIKELEKTAAEKPASDSSLTAPPPVWTGNTGQPGAVTPPPSAPATSAPEVVGSPGTTPPGAPPALGGGLPSSGSGATEPPPASPTYSTSGAGATVPTGTSPPAPDAAAQGSGRRTAGIAVAAAGGGLFVVGAIFGIVARNQSKKVETAARNGEAFDPSVQSLGERSETLQWIGYGIGVAAIATGVILYVTSPRAAEATPTPTVAVAPLVSPGAGGALLRVTF